MTANDATVSGPPRRRGRPGRSATGRRAGPPGREQDRRRFRRRFVQESVYQEAPASRRRAARADRLSPSRQRPVRARRDGRRTRRIDPLPAAVDTAFASPAQDRLADVSDALATILTSRLAREETGALP